MDFNKLPKIELHLHLDCSLSYKVVKKINPTINYKTYRELFVAPPKCKDLVDYLSSAISAVKLLQTKEHLELATLDLFDQLKTDNVIYAEIRFAPLLHTEQGLSAEEVVRCVSEATTEGMRLTGMHVGIILCTLRHFNEAQSIETVKLVEQFKDNNIVGFDIAADEAGYPIDQHKAAFIYARNRSLNVTAHAGEAKGAESVWETLKEFHPSRIGHGVRSVEDPLLLQFLKINKLHLEICPTSNVQTNVVNRIEDHPADFIYNEGVSMGLNTDCRTISDTTLSREYQLLHEYFKWNKSHFLKCNLEAIKYAFTTEDIKAELTSKINMAYAS